MIRQRLKGIFSQRTVLPAPGQAGRSATWMAIVLGVLSALILLTAVHLLREKTRRPFTSLPPQPPVQTLPEKMQAADQVVSRIISSLSLNEDHVTLEPFPRKEGELTWNESVITITLPPDISLHQVEHVTGRSHEFLKPEGLTADTVYDSDTCLHITMAV